MNEVVDLTEESLLKAVEELRDTLKTPVLRPTRYVVMPWAAEEIVRDYGELNEVNYFRWLTERNGL